MVSNCPSFASDRDQREYRVQGVQRMHNGHNSPSFSPDDAQVSCGSPSGVPLPRQSVAWSLLKGFRATTTTSPAVGGGGGAGGRGRDRETEEREGEREDMDEEK